jgi:methylated-DNA-[protein]-cysteine S-methyltransferase
MERMRPVFVSYVAPGWGVGELWLEGERVLHSSLPRPRPPAGGDGSSRRASALVTKLLRFFAGKAVDFDDVELDLEGEGGFYRDCARALRAIPRGEVVTYGELAALAGYPGAARAAGTFCGRCELSPFVPTHRVVSAGGIGSYGDLGVDYKRRLLELEGVRL